VTVPEPNGPITITPTSACSRPCAAVRSRLLDAALQPATGSSGSGNIITSRADRSTAGSVKAARGQCAHGRKALHHDWRMSGASNGGQAQHPRRVLRRRIGCGPGITRADHLPSGQTVTLGGSGGGTPTPADDHHASRHDDDNEPDTITSAGHDDPRRRTDPSWKVRSAAGTAVWLQTSLASRRPGSGSPGSGSGGARPARDARSVIVGDDTNHRRSARDGGNVRTIPSRPRERHAHSNG